MPILPACCIHSTNSRSARKPVTGYFQAVLGGVTGEQLIVTVDGEKVAQFEAMRQ